MRHLHYFDPQLVDFSGHYFNYAEQAAKELGSRGIPVKLYARRNCQVATCAGVKPEPTFSHDIFQEAWSDKTVWAMENFHNINQAFLADLCRLSPERFSAEDVVFFPSLLQNQLHGVALWLGRLPPARRPAVVVLLRFLNHAMDYMKEREHHELVALQYRFAAKALFTVQPRAVLCADTSEMAGAYHAITGQTVVELPIAMDPWLASTRTDRPANARPVVTYQGHTSRLKGFHLLPEVIEKCAMLRPRPRFVVQVQSRQAAIKEQLVPTMEKLDRLAGDNVRVVNGSLTPALYFSLMDEADIVLLPYSAAFYGHCSSGIFAEAAALGKIIVVPANTVQARQGEKYQLGVVSAEEWTGKALAGAIATALENLPALRAKAEAAAPRFRAEQSVRTFWDRLLSTLPSVTTAIAA